MKTFKQSLVILLLLLCCYPCVHAGAAEEYKPLSMSQRFDQLEKDLDQPNKRKAIDCIEDAIKMMGAFQNDGSMRTQKVKWWLRLIQIIRSHKVPNFDHRHGPPSRGILRPPELNHVRIPSSVRPEDIKDPKDRERYRAALKEDQEYWEFSHFQLMLPRKEEWATFYFKQYLHTWYSDCAEDHKEIDGVFTEAGLTEAQKNNYKAVIGKWEPPRFTPLP
jgi:hypothetical protein